MTLPINSQKVSASKILAETSIEPQLKNAIFQTDKELLDYAHRITTSRISPYEKSSSDIYPLSLFTSRLWQFPLYFADDVLLRYTEFEFKSLSPLQKHLEIIRAQAEALLIHHKLNFCVLSDLEYNQNISRAIGILPMHIEDQLDELLTCPGFLTPDERQIDYNNIDALINNLDMLKKELGTSLELIYAMLLLSGIKSNDEFLSYGQKTDIILSRITNLPLVSAQLKHAQSTNALESQLNFLTVLREQIAELLPMRQLDETNFLFINLLDQFVWDKNWERTKPIRATKDVFAVFDAILLTHYGFTVYLVISEKNEYYLEIVFPSLSVWWHIPNYRGKSTSEISPISFVSPTVKYHYDYRFLIAKIMANIADVYTQIGRELDIPLRMYRSVVKLYPDYPDFLHKLVQLYIRTGQVHLAVPQIKTLVELYSNSADINHLLGITYCLLKDYDNAIFFLEKAVSLRPDLIDAYNNLANCYYQNGNLNQAQKIYTRLLTLQPDYFEGVFGLGNVYFQLKQYAQALRYFEKCLRIIMQHKEESQEKQSQMLRTLYNLAQTYYELGKIENSIKTYKELLKLNPDHASAWYNLGIIYRNQGDTKQAIKCITQAIQLNPNLMR
ncbi:MAG: tetratricopeptide repeat protein [candidate division WOR-3 bacterium]